MVLGTPILTLAQRAVGALARAMTDRSSMPEVLLPADIFISENI
jgi:hypothetical protein